MDSILLALQLLLAAVFATAGIAKLLDQHGTRVALVRFGVPVRVVPVVGILLPLAELAVAVALIPVPSARWGALAAAVLLLTFAAGIANAMAHGRAPNCHCFGNVHSAPAGPGTLARNLALAAIAAFVLVGGPGSAIDDWVTARSTAELVAVGVGILAVVLGVLCVRLWSQNRALRSALRLARVDLANELAAKPEGLPVGAPAPSFELSTLDGETRSLASLRAGGRPVLLVFFDPGCGPCIKLAPHVARWQAALSERVAIAVISEGNPEFIRAVWAWQAQDVLLDPDSTVTRETYKVLTWPSAIAIGRDGRIAHELAYSQDTMEAVIRTLLDTPAPARVPAMAGDGQVG